MALDTAYCKHCGTRGLVKKDPHGRPVDAMCVNGHPFEYDKIERMETPTERRRRMDGAPPSAGPQVAPKGDA